MKLYYLKLALLLFGCITFTACSKEDTISPAQIQGKWNVESSSASFQLKGSEPKTSDEDLRNAGIYFEFFENGKYTTNASIGVDNIAKGNGTIYNGNYSITNGKISLAFIDSDLGALVRFTFSPQFKGNDLTITLTKEALVSDIAAMKGTINAFEEMVLQALASSVEQFRFSIAMTKA
jgi:hypothetical protein